MKKKFPLKSFLQNGLLFCVTIAFLLGGTEIFLRLFWTQSDFFYRVDPELGALLIPNAEGIWKVDGRTITVEINPWGFRGWEADQEKDPQVTRIAVLGDSFVEAMQVEENVMSHHLLEEWLIQNVPGQRFEVLAFGVSGYGTAQQYLLYEKVVKPFDPDVVVSLLTPANDIRNNHRTLENDPHRPYFVLDDENHLQLINFDYSDSLLRRMVSYSLNRADFLRHSDTYRFFMDNVVRRLLYSKKNSETIPNEYFVFSCDSNDETWTEAWNVTTAILDQWKREVESEGKQWLLVNGTTYFQVHDDDGLNELKTLYPAMTDLCWDLQKPNDMLQAWATQTNTLYLDLLPAFQKEYLEQGIEHHLYEDGHWNEDGHRVVAETLGAWLISSGIVDINIP